MKSGRAALRYAKALLDFSIQIQEEKTVFGEMQNIFSVMQSSTDLDDALNNPVLPTKQKRQIINEVFNKSSKTTQKLFNLLSQNNREGILDVVAQKYID
jgi:F-type H+-transporting ATPase subunit delta